MPGLAGDMSDPRFGYVEVTDGLRAVCDLTACHWIVHGVHGDILYHSIISIIYNNIICVFLYIYITQFLE